MAAATAAACSPSLMGTTPPDSLLRTLCSRDPTFAGFRAMVEEEMRKHGNADMNFAQCGAIVLQEYCVKTLHDLKKQSKKVRYEGVTHEVLTERLAYFGSDSFRINLQQALPERIIPAQTARETGYAGWLNLVFNVAFPDWRDDVLSPLSNQDQCVRALNIQGSGSAGKKIAAMQAAGNTRCYLCGQKIILTEARMECEHILPIASALSHFGLISHSRGAYTDDELKLLALEYRFSHRCCNQLKSNYAFFIWDDSGTFRNNNLYRVNEVIIRHVLRLIGRSIRYDCPILHRKNPSVFTVEADERFSGTPQWENERFREVSSVVQPIVHVMNGNVAFFDNIDEYLLWAKFKLLSALTSEGFKQALMGVGDRTVPIPKSQAEKNKERAAKGQATRRRNLLEARKRMANSKAAADEAHNTAVESRAARAKRGRPSGGSRLGKKNSAASYAGGGIDEINDAETDAAAVMQQVHQLQADINIVITNPNAAVSERINLYKVKLFHLKANMYYLLAKVANAYEADETTSAANKPLETEVARLCMEAHAAYTQYAVLYNQYCFGDEDDSYVPINDNWEIPQELFEYFEVRIEPGTPVDMDAKNVLAEDIIHNILTNRRFNPNMRDLNRILVQFLEQEQRGAAHGAAADAAAPSAHGAAAAAASAAHDHVAASSGGPGASGAADVSAAYGDPAAFAVPASPIAVPAASGSLSGPGGLGSPGDIGRATGDISGAAFVAPASPIAVPPDVIVSPITVPGVHGAAFVAPASPIPPMSPVAGTAIGDAGATKAAPLMSPVARKPKSRKRYLDSDNSAMNTTATQKRVLTDATTNFANINPMAQRGGNKSRKQKKPTNRKTRNRRNRRKQKKPTNRKTRNIRNRRKQKKPTNRKTRNQKNRRKQKKPTNRKTRNRRNRRN